MNLCLRSLCFKFRSTMVTVLRVLLMLGFSACRTNELVSLGLLPYEFCAYDTCRNGNDGITHEHHYGSKELSRRSDRRKVSIAYGGHGNDTAIDSVKHIAHVRIIRGFYSPKQRAHTDVQDEDEDEEDEYLVHTLL